MRNLEVPILGGKEWVTKVCMRRGNLRWQINFSTLNPVNKLPFSPPENFKFDGRGRTVNVASVNKFEQPLLIVIFVGFLTTIVESFDWKCEKWKGSWYPFICIQLERSDCSAVRCTDLVVHTRTITDVWMYGFLFEFRPKYGKV